MRAAVTPFVQCYGGMDGPFGFQVHRYRRLHDRHDRRPNLAGALVIASDPSNLATLPGLLCERARRTPDALAFRSKARGVYRERTWHAYAGLVSCMALALKELGIRVGDRVAFITDAREEWCVCELAVQALGAAVYAIPPTSNVEQASAELRRCGAALLICEDRETLSLVAAALRELPQLRAVVMIEDAEAGGTLAAVHSYADLLAGIAGPDIAWLADQSVQVAAAAPSVIGRAGHQTAGEQRVSAEALLARYPVLAGEAHRVVAYLPPSNAFGREVAITLPFVSLMIPHFAEGPGDLLTTIFEIAPTVLVVTPHLLNALTSRLHSALDHTSHIERTVYRWAWRTASVRAGGAGRSKSMSLVVADTIIFRRILNDLGFSKLKLLLCTGSGLAPETAELWRRFGVNLVQHDEDAAPEALACTHDPETSLSTSNAA